MYIALFYGILLNIYRKGYASEISPAKQSQYIMATRERSLSQNNPSVLWLCARDSILLILILIEILTSAVHVDFSL